MCVRVCVIFPCPTNIPVVLVAPTASLLVWAAAVRLSMSAGWIGQRSQVQWQRPLMFTLTTGIKQRIGTECAAARSQGACGTSALCASFPLFCRRRAQRVDVPWFIFDACSERVFYGNHGHFGFSFFDMVNAAQTVEQKKKMDRKKITFKSRIAVIFFELTQKNIWHVYIISK